MSDVPVRGHAETEHPITKEVLDGTAQLFKDYMAVDARLVLAKARIICWAMALGLSIAATLLGRLKKEPQ